MDNYIPPFDITNIMLDRISSIMKKIGKLDNYKDLNKMPVLRRNNRIRSIHSSLAIEANSLSFDQVKDIIDGNIYLSYTFIFSGKCYIHVLTETVYYGIHNAAVEL